MIEDFVFLLNTYWPFLAIALLIGIATGWYSQDGA